MRFLTFDLFGELTLLQNYITFCSILHSWQCCKSRSFFSDWLTTRTPLQRAQNSVTTLSRLYY